MQSSSQAVCLNLQQQPYSDGKEDFRLRSALSFQIQQVKDHVLWSLCNFIFCNFCCLGFAALVFSIKSRDRKVVGDVEGASSYGKTALCLNITALVVSILFFSIFIALIVTGVIALKNIFFAFGK